MMNYPDNVKVGDAVHNAVTGDSYDVVALEWRNGRGWEARTVAPDGYNGPTFYPHPDRMPSPDWVHPNELEISK